MKPMLFTALVAATLAGSVSAQFSTALPIDDWTPPVSGGAPESLTAYMHDDGSSWNSMGITGGGHVAWLQRFSTAGGADVITSVSVAFGTALSPGSSPPAGSPATVAVWNDLDNDGDPTTNLQLVSTRATTIQNPDTDILNKVFVPPAPVSGFFFVGAYTNHGATRFPAPLDDSTQSFNRAWLTGSQFMGGFNPNNLNSASHVGVFELDDIGFPSVWLLRAEGIGTPATFCTAKTTAVCGASSIGSTGIPSGSAPSGFVVSAGPTRGCRAGLLLYSNQAPVAGVPFGGPGNGVLCLAPGGLRRAGPIDSGGTAPSVCDGVLAIDMNRFNSLGWAAAGCNPPPGQTNPAGFLGNFGVMVSAQMWYRDSVTTGQGISDALMWTVGP